jgi:hypothetical protein
VGGLRLLPQIGDAAIGQVLADEKKLSTLKLKAFKNYLIPGTALASPAT